MAGTEVLPDGSQCLIATRRWHRAGTYRHGKDSVTPSLIPVTIINPSMFWDDLLLLRLSKILHACASLSEVEPSETEVEKYLCRVQSVR